MLFARGLAAWLLAVVVGVTVCAADAAETYIVDHDASKSLTTYLHKHRLPLVGAQVLQPDAGGRRKVMLYGYVASEFGKRDAEGKARSFLKQKDLGLVNRITVRPEIQNRGGEADSGNESESRF